ncbi:MAG: thioredoxin [Litorivicinaceae bacterium]|jgi:putative thioredoxin
MSDAYSIQVTSETFETDVLQKSQETPVLVDFYAEWCGPCKTLGPMLERLADEYAGAFILAKVDADAEQMLVAGMGVRSLPTVVLFKNGQPADHFMGALPEGEIRAILDKHVERVEASPLERAAELVALGQYDEAIALYQLITADDPENYDVYLDMAQALLKKGDLDSAEAIVERLPDAQKMDPRAKSIVAGKVFQDLLAGAPDRATCESRIAANDEDSEARYFLAVHLMVSDDVESAITHLLTIIRTDRQYNDDAARLLLIQIFDRLGNDDPRARTGRRQLATLLMV